MIAGNMVRLDMTYRAFDVVKTMLHHASSGLTNLQIQKILYIMHMERIGKTGEPLIYEHFEAWDYGPVCPKIYSKLKMYGNKTVNDVFYINTVLNDEIGEFIKSSVSELEKISGAALVQWTHDPVGAWFKNYEPGAYGAPIHNSEIQDEYNSRRKKIDSASQSADK